MRTSPRSVAGTRRNARCMPAYPATTRASEAIQDGIGAPPSWIARCAKPEAKHMSSWRPLLQTLSIHTSRSVSAPSNNHRLFMALARRNHRPSPASGSRQRCAALSSRQMPLARCNRRRHAAAITALGSMGTHRAAATDPIALSAPPTIGLGHRRPRFACTAGSPTQQRQTETGARDAHQATTSVASGCKFRSAVSRHRPTKTKIPSVEHLNGAKSILQLSTKPTPILTIITRPTR